MLRILLLFGLCLLLPGITYGSNQFEAIALGEMLPLFGGLLLATLALLAAGVFITKAELRAPRKRPGLLYMSTVLLALIIGLLISGIFYQLNKERDGFFPNLLTEVSIPLTLLFIFLKQLKRNSSAVLWIGGGAACLLTLTAAVAGLASFGESHHHSGHNAILAELFLTPVIWLIFFGKIKKWVANDASESKINVWLVPVIGPVVAVLYRIFLYAARAQLFGFDGTSYVVQEQGMRLLLYCAFGFLAMAAVFWRLPIRQPEPHSRPGLRA